MPAEGYEQVHKKIMNAVKSKRKEFADLYALPRRRFAALVVVALRYGVKEGAFHDLDTMLETMERRLQIGARHK